MGKRSNSVELIAQNHNSNIEGCVCTKYYSMILWQETLRLHVFFIYKPLISGLARFDDFFDNKGPLDTRDKQKCHMAR